MRLSSEARAKDRSTGRWSRLAIRALEAQGAEVTDVDLASYDLPLYSAAIESGAFPADAERLKRVFAAQDGLLFVSPEYNGSVSPLLKNAIDWASRPTGDEGLVALVAYRGKAAAIMSASVSPFGGLRGLIHLRQILSTVQALVIPEQVLIPNAHAAFDESGALKDAARIAGEHDGDAARQGGGRARRLTLGRAAFLVAPVGLERCEQGVEAVMAKPIGQLVGELIHRALRVLCTSGRPFR